MTHFLLHCQEYSCERQNIPLLQQPYQENTDELIGKLLFDEEGIDQKKEAQYQMWKKRKREHVTSSIKKFKRRCCKGQASTNHLNLNLNTRMRRTASGKSEEVRT